MRVYSGQPLGEFLSGVREGWIKYGLGPLWIHKLDELMELGSLGEREKAIEAAVVEREIELEIEFRSEIDELRNENDRLATRVAELEADIDDLKFNRS